MRNARFAFGRAPAASKGALGSAESRAGGFLAAGPSQPVALPYERSFRHDAHTPLNTMSCPSIWKPRASET